MTTTVEVTGPGGASVIEIAGQGPRGLQGAPGPTGPIGPIGPQGGRGPRVYADALAGAAPNPANYPNSIPGDSILDADTGNVWELA